MAGAATAWLYDFRDRPYAALRNVSRFGALRFVGRVEGAKSGLPGFAAAKDFRVPIKWKSAMVKPPCLNVVTICKTGSS